MFQDKPFDERGEWITCTAELITRFGSSIVAKPSGPVQIEANMRGGVGWSKQITLSGGEDFAVSSAAVDGHGFQLTLVPIIRAEFTSASIPFRHAAMFRFRLNNGEHELSLERLVDELLTEPCERTPGKTWGETFAAHIKNRVARAAKSALGAHQEFGSW